MIHKIEKLIKQLKQENKNPSCAEFARMLNRREK